MTDLMVNKTGLQPVSRPVERVHYLGGWSGGLFWWKKCTFRETSKRALKKMAGKIAHFDANIQN